MNLDTLYTFVILFSQCGSPRLVLSYVREEAGELDFCDGHSPAVTITFVCPSERREVSGLSPGDCNVAQVSLGCPRERVSGLGAGRVWVQEAGSYDRGTGGLSGGDELPGIASVT